MSFASPERLFLLLAIAALLTAYVIVQRRRQRYALRFSNVAMVDKIAPESPGWRRHIVAAVFLGLITSLIVGYAEPEREEQVPSERASIILAIDISLSMGATDIDPSRLAGAQEAAIAFLDSVPPSINIGLVTFAEFATIRVAPTTDRLQVQQAISRLELAPATAIGEAIFAGLTALEDVPSDELGSPPPGVIFLMSDGETTMGRPADLAVVAALEAGVPISTIAFGTTAGVVEIPDPDTGERFAEPVPVNGAELQRIASLANGKFFEAATTEELTQVYTDLGSSIGFDTELRPIQGWFVGLALALALLVSVLSLTWFSRLP